MSFEKLYQSLNQLSSLISVISASIAQIGQQFKEIYQLESTITLKTSKIWLDMSNSIKDISHTVQDQMIIEETRKMNQQFQHYYSQSQNILQQFEYALLMYSVQQPKTREQRFQSPQKNPDRNKLFISLNNPFLHE